MSTFSASAPGKVILFGEHAVVHGASCIAASIDLRTTATIQIAEDDSLATSDLHLDRQCITLALPGLSLCWRWQLQELRNFSQEVNEVSGTCVREATPKLTTALREVARSQISESTKESLVAGAAAFLFLHMHILGLRPTKTVLLSELPMGAGLGSSAAYSVALVGAMLAAAKAPGFGGSSAKRGLDAETHKGLIGVQSQGERTSRSGCCSCHEGVGSDPTARCTSRGGPLSNRGQAVTPNALEVVNAAQKDNSHNPLRPEGCIAKAVSGNSTSGSKEADERGLVDTPGHEKLEGAELANAWAFQAECIIHGRPSGVDNTVSCYGGAICFKQGAITRLPHSLSLRMLLTNTNVGRDTKALVAGLGQRAAGLKAVYDHLFKAVDEISQAFLRASVDGAAGHDSLQDLVEELVDVNQAILRALGVSHPKIEDIIATAAEQGFHSKLTGAGGGGCVLTLLRDSIDNVLNLLLSELQQKGFSCFQVDVAGNGLQWTSS